MAKAKFRTSSADTKFGREPIAAAKEALAHSKNKIALPTRIIDRDPQAAKRALIEAS